MTTKVESRRLGLRSWLGALGLVGLIASAAGCGGGGGGTCAPGQIQTSWIVTQNGAVVECLPGDEVDMRVDDDNHIFTFACSDHSGVTTAVPGGVTHSLTFQLYDANNNLLSSTNAMAFYVPCGASASTPQVEFPVQ